MMRLNGGSLSVVVAWNLSSAITAAVVRISYDVHTVYGGLRITLCASTVHAPRLKTKRVVCQRVAIVTRVHGDSIRNSGTTCPRCNLDRPGSRRQTEA